MKNQFKNFSIIWLAGVILFSAITILANFAIPEVNPGISFWAAYALTIIAYAIQMGAAYKFFNEENKDKVFLNMPLLALSKRCVVISMIIGTVFMVASPLVTDALFWVAPIVAVIILVAYVIKVTKASSAAEAVTAVEEKVTQNTAFIKNLTAQSEALVSRAKSDEAKDIANKVYEAFRFSNKSTHTGLADIENRIYGNFTAFADAISSSDDIVAKSTGNKILELLDRRNTMAKTYKN